MEIFVIESIDINKIAIASYIAIGILLATVGPLSKAISDEIGRVGDRQSYGINFQQQPSEKKIQLFRILMTLGVILFWPILIWGIFKERRLKAQLERDRIEKSVGLWFQHMGGCGLIYCRDCQHSEKVISFVHGINSSHSGFQCQSCGNITSLTGGGRGKANQYKESLICGCGGAFDRDKVIFCPQCKSRNLLYDMEFIT